MTDKILVVGDLLESKFILIDAADSISSVHNLLDSSGAVYAVVTTSSHPLGLITAKMATLQPNAEQLVRQLVSSCPAFVVDVATPLDQAVS